MALFKSREDRAFDEARTRLEFMQAWTGLKQSLGGLDEEDRRRVGKELEQIDFIMKQVHGSKKSLADTFIKLLDRSKRKS